MFYKIDHGATESLAFNALKALKSASPSAVARNSIHSWLKIIAANVLAWSAFKEVGYRHLHNLS
jgi:hypothetical protein